MRRSTHVPNYMTICRLALSPVFIVLFLVETPWAAAGALGVAAIFEVTDFLDGYLARRWKLVSSLGKLIDPLADSMARLSVFLAFTTERAVRMHPWPVILVALLFYRDAIVAYVRTFAASTQVVLGARLSGKLKAVFQGAGILIFLAVRTAAYFHAPARAYVAPVFYGVMFPIVVVTLISGVDYIRANWGAISQMASGRHPNGGPNR